MNQRSIRLAVYKRWQTDHLCKLLNSQVPFFLLTLQLDYDATVCHHSHFPGMTEVIEEVVRSFARFALPHTHLLIKNHPLDNGLINFGRVTRVISEQTGVADRVLFINGGHLPTLLKRAAGVVTVNSTTGLQAIRHRRPTKVLGKALYGLPGLVDLKSLDAFWQNPTPPDAALCAAFRRRLLSQCQFNGSFYTKEGIAQLIPSLLPHLVGECANENLSRSDYQSY